MDIARPTGTDHVQDSRGVAIADLDRDGRLDLVIGNNNAAPAIYMNRFTRTGNWVEFKLVGTSSNRDAIGARVQVHLAGRTLTRQVEAGSGYASAAMLPVHVGLGNATSIEAVTIHWPSGFVQRIEGDQVSLNRRIRIEEKMSKIATVTPSQ